MIYDTLNQKRIATLHPTVQSLVQKWLTMLGKAGNMEVLITCGYRSKAEQDALYALGRTKPGKIVTNAKGGQSLHQYKVAFDFCPVDAQGNCLWSDNLKFAMYAGFAKSVGLEWGGEFPNFPDMPHLQFMNGHPLSFFQKGGTL